MEILDTQDIRVNVEITLINKNLKDTQDIIAMVNSFLSDIDNYTIENIYQHYWDTSKKYKTLYTNTETDD